MALPVLWRHLKDHSQPDIRCCIQIMLWGALGRCISCWGNDQRFTPNPSFQAISYHLGTAIASPALWSCGIYLQLKLGRFCGCTCLPLDITFSWTLWYRSFSNLSPCFPLYSAIGTFSNAVATSFQVESTSKTLALSLRYAQAEYFWHIPFCLYRRCRGQKKDNPKRH